jgi:Tol biopolymer transport system component
MIKMYILFSLLLVLTSSSCKKQLLNSQQVIAHYNADTCFNNAPPMPPNAGFSLTTRVLPKDFHAPFFNPINNNQFVYVLLDYKKDVTSICCYDLATHAGWTVITLPSNAGSPVNIGQPRWSVKDWIIYRGINCNLYKIKSTGDSLTQITSTGNNLYPAWSPKGDKLVFEQQLDPIESPDHTHTISNMYFLITDEFGNHLDTLNTYFGFSKGDWSSNNLIATSTNNNDPDISVISNFSSEQKLTSFPDEMSLAWNYLFSIKWAPDNVNIVYSSGYGIFKLNTDTRAITRLRQGCISKMYEHVSVSPDGAKIIAEELIQYALADTITTGQESHVVLMNIDGTNEVTIF